MKKNTLIILFLIPIYYSFSEIKLTNNLSAPFSQTDTSSIISFSKLDFNYIKSKTSKLETKIRMYGKFCNEENKMSKEFISEYLNSQKVTIGDTVYFDPTNFDGFCFKQYKEFPTYNLFTFTYQNDSCCNTLYAVTTEKGSLDIINIGAIAYTGSKDGWVGDKFGKWISEDIMDMMTISYYDDDFVEDNNNYRLDTTWSIIRIDKEGILKENAYKRVKYLEGRKIE